jgi:hypothetical protein
MTARIRVLLVAAVALIAAGCASRPTSIDAQWMSPTIAGSGKVQNVLVIGALRDTTQRRLLEDRMVEELGAAGVKASTSHRVLAGGEVTEDELRAAAAGVGATHVLISSIAGMTTDVRVTPGMVTGPGWGPGWSRTAPMGPGWRGMSSYYNTAWSRSIPPEVRTIQQLHGDTRLFEVASLEVVWSVATTTRTSGSNGNVTGLIDQFARLIVATLKSDSLIKASP